MKKTISINISGIIFHIEEDGYDSLKRYLDSIHAYFGTFDDSSEILSDIESRIAELFLSKLADGKQVITAEDVESLKTTMGNVSDFKAAEAEEVTKEVEPGRRQQSQTHAGPMTPPKRLFRDGRRKILGGIGAGLAHYFSIDPVWPRLILALLALGSSGVGIVLYIILWIVLPVSDNLEDEPAVKKMFRDPANKVLGGVASGVAAFFGTDTTLIRVLFVVTALLGGFGFLIYIILWLSLPEAKSITDKIQMQGDPVTLSNIENSIKKATGEKADAEESLLAKIVLFPFRLLAAVLRGLADFLGPLLRGAVDVLRVAVGLVISLTALAGIAALVMSVGIAIGLFAYPEWSWAQNWSLNTPALPIGAFRNTFSGWLIAAAFFTALIPLVFVMLLGISAIARRIVFNAYVGWGLFVLFFLSVGLLSLMLPAAVYSFREEATYKTEQVFDVSGKTPVLQLRHVGLDDYEAMDLTIKPHRENNIKVVKYFRSQGRTKKEALLRAREVSYTVSQRDSVLTFDSNLLFSDTARFRAQRVEVDVFLPENKAVVIDGALWHHITNLPFRWYPELKTEGRTHRFTFDGRTLVCTDCPDNGEPDDETAWSKPDRQSETELTDFHAVDINGFARVHIAQGNDYAVRLDGPEDLREQYDVSVVGQTLIIHRENSRLFWRGKKGENKFKVSITMPHLRDLEMKGAGEIFVTGFREEEIDIELAGAVKLEGNFNAQNLTIELTGASSATLSGTGEFLDADITGASSLRAFRFEVQRAVVEAHGASSAKVFATGSVEISKGVASSVSTRGGGAVTERN
jgi:phage shock protein PspC (stress-responsive transcriptional regulator)